MADNDKPRTAIETMEELVDGFSTYVQDAQSRQVKGRRYRNSLLWVHTAAALAMSPTFAALNTENQITAQWAVLRQFPGSPVSIAVILGLGGFVLGTGCLAHSRRIQIVGLLLLATFYMIVAIGFGLAVIYWYRGGFGDLSANLRPPMYPPVFYLHMSAIMLVHMGTLISRVTRGENNLSLS